MYGGCPPGTAGVPPAPMSGTASPVSATGTDRQRRRGFPWDLPLRFTPNGRLPGPLPHSGRSAPSVGQRSDPATFDAH